MSSIPLHASDTLDIAIDPEVPCLSCEWKGHQSEDSVREGCEKMLALMLEHQIFRILNDNTRLVGNWSQATKWVATDFAPRILNAGLIAFAWVYSPKLISQASTEITLAAIGPFPQIRTFYSVQEAKAWLLSHPGPADP